MPQEIELLGQIHLLLALILAFYVASLLIRVLIAMFAYRKKLKEEIKNKYSSQLGELFDKGKIEEVILICDKKLMELPNDVISLWHLGKAYFHRGEYMRAKDAFDRLVKIDPAAEKGYAKPFIEKIDERMK